MKTLKLKSTFNKNNKQINFSLPKKKFPKDMKHKFEKLKGIKIKILDYDWDI